MSVSMERRDAAPVRSGCTWPAALVALMVLVALFGQDWFRDWLDDRDDARLDDLRRTAVEACAEHTESARSLEDCVASTLAATGQPT